MNNFTETVDQNMMFYTFHILKEREHVRIGCKKFEFMFFIIVLPK